MISDIRETLKSLFKQGDVIELRAVGPPLEMGHSLNGYCKHNWEKLAETAKEWNEKGLNCYLCANPVREQKYAVRPDTYGRVLKGEGVSRADVPVYRNLAVDIDADRPNAGNSAATDVQLDAAKVVTKRIYTWLCKKFGKDSIIIATSGNGFHLLVRLPDVDAKKYRSLFKRFHKAIGIRFNVEGQAHVDESTYRQEQLVACFGVLKRKGEASKDNPHRQSKVLVVPDTIVPINFDTFLAVMESAPTSKAKAKPKPTQTPSYVTNLPALLDSRNVEYTEDEFEFEGGDVGSRYVLTICPFNVEHNRGEAVILQRSNGTVIFSCRHDTCNHTWEELCVKWERPELGATVEMIKVAEPAQAKPADVLVVAEYTPFPVAELPLPLQAFVKDATQSMRCDAAYVCLPLLAGLFSVVGATRRLQIRTDWFEQAVMWEATVGESGTQKSGAQELPLRPLEAMQAARFDELPELLEDYEREKLLFENDKKLWHSQGRKKGEEPPEKPLPPRIAQFIVCDTTIEGLGEILDVSRRGVLCSHDELIAWLGGMGRYKAGHGRGELGQWLSMHRADRLLVNRKTSGKPVIYVRHAAVSIVGGITPGAFRKAMVDQDNLDSGLAARLVVAMPPRVPKKWGEGDGTALSMPLIKRLYQRLLALDFRYEDDSPVPQDLLLSAEATELAKVFVNEHGEKQQAYEGHLASVYSKVEAMSFRFALLHCLLRWAAGDAPTESQGYVKAEDLAAGIELGKWCALEWERVFSSFWEPAEARACRELVEWVRAKGGETTVRELTHGQAKYREAGAAEAALEMLVAAGRGYWRTEQQERGRPKRIFCLLGPVT